MLSIAVDSYRGCQSAAIALDPIALVAGRNAAGKSSVLQGVAAALTGTALIVDGATKAAADLFVRDGTASAAKVRIETPKGMVEVTWPSCEVTSRGTAPHASAYAAGTKSLVHLKRAERAQILASYLQAAPTHDDLAAALPETPKSEIDKIWRAIEASSWDIAHASQKEIGARLKGSWQSVTGRNWGARVAQGWVPEGWTADLATASEDELKREEAAAEDAWRLAIANAAITDSTRENLAKEADMQASLREALQDQQKAVTAIGEELARARAAAAALPAEQPQPLACPHCGAPILVVREGLLEMRLEKLHEISAAEKKRRRLAKAELDGDVSRLTAALSKASADAATFAASLQAAELAGARLAAMGDSHKSRGDPEAAAQLVKQAKGRTAAWCLKQRADDLRDEVNCNDRLLTVLAPDGLRAEKMRSKLEQFGNILAELAGFAFWQAIWISPEMVIYYGNRPYGLLSASEQYRVRVLLALAMARLDGSDAVLFDGAEILDNQGRGDLFSLLDAAGIPALVAMTLSRPDRAPNLASTEMGATYWLEEGVLRCAR